MTRSPLAALATLAVFAAGLAYAHEGATGIVAARMDLMEDMARRMKAIGEMLKGEVPFDAAAVRENAVALHENCHKAAGQFPEGSHHHMSKAAEAVWKQPAEFEARMDGLHEALEGFVEASAGGTQDALQAPFREVGQACSGCHEQFRVPD